MTAVILSPAALFEVNESRHWYELRDPGLGTEFVRALDECISRIQRQPDLFRQIKPPYRKALLRRFPFQVIFEAREDCIWILAVFHAKRDSKELKRRLR